MLVREVQPSNAPPSIMATLLGMVTLVRPVQPKNAEFPILVTLLGMTTLVTEVLELPKEVLELPKIGGQLFPTCFTAYPPNTLGIVTAPVAVEAVIVAPPFSTM